MRIVDVCAFYSPFGGGVRTYVDHKLRAASALGHEIVVIVPGERDSVIHKGRGAFLATIASPALPLDARYRYFNDEPRLHRELDRWKPDHLEASSPWSSASMVARWTGHCTRSLVLHSDPLSSYAYRWFGGVASRAAIDRMFGRYWEHLRRLEQGFDMLVSGSNDYRERLTAAGLGKATTIGFGVEPDRFSPALRDERLRSDLLGSLGLPASGTLLVGIGRLSPEKRWKMVVRAVATASAAKPVGLLIVGSGRQQSQLERACRRQHNIRLVGQVNDRSQLARVLASADALVHGCEAETFGLAVSEARASGVPVIVPDRGGAREQLALGAGVAYRAGSEDALSTAILDFIHCDPVEQRRIALRSCGVRTMDDHFHDLFAAYAEIASKPVTETPGQEGRAQAVAAVS